MGGTQTNADPEGPEDAGSHALSTLDGHPNDSREDHPLFLANNYVRAPQVQHAVAQRSFLRGANSGVTRIGSSDVKGTK